MIIVGDCLSELKRMEDSSVHTCVTSPPYWGLRDYGEDDQIGLETTPEEFVNNMVEVFHEVKRVLRDDGTCWLNLGDTYYGGGGHGSHSENNKGFQAQDIRKDPEKFKTMGFSSSVNG